MSAISRPRRLFDLLRAGLVIAAVLPSNGPIAWSQDSTKAKAPADSTKKLAPEALQALVAPIALYPDALLAQTLAASTYPLEIIQLHQWMGKHPDLKDKALADSI